MDRRPRSSQVKARQSARFIEAAKAAGADQKAFERAFKKIVPPKKAAKAR